MSELKDTWKKTGRDVENAIDSIGRSVVKSVKVGIKKLDQWANADDENSSGTSEPAKDPKGDNEAK